MMPNSVAQTRSGYQWLWEVEDGLHVLWAGGNVSINSKADHPLGKTLGQFFLMGEFPTPGQKRSSKPPLPGPLKTS